MVNPRVMVSGSADKELVFWDTNQGVVEQVIKFSEEIDFIEVDKL